MTPETQNLIAVGGGAGGVLLFLLGWLRITSAKVDKKVNYKTCEDKREKIDETLTQGREQFAEIKEKLKAIPDMQQDIKDVLKAVNQMNGNG